jgi:hypothetical protein
VDEESVGRVMARLEVKRGLLLFRIFFKTMIYKSHAGELGVRIHYVESRHSCLQRSQDDSFELGDYDEC